jgi:U32 family peptidase
MTHGTPEHIALKKPELLAPAGEFAALQAAIQSGCDAAYFGVGELNMRQVANSFHLTDITEIHRRCEDAGIRAYLTLNTIIFPGELHTVQRILDAAHGKVDAVICHDWSVIDECGHRGIPVHISTQASVSNPAAAKRYAGLGAVRVVPARECSLEELRLIREGCGIELEVFVHGAMCVSVSGRCFISDLVCGKSGNRGECTQNCRREYQIRDVEDGHEFVLGNRYVMSARDLCTLPFIERLCDTGIDAFKIEGRGRNPEYVRTVVAAYRSAIDAWSEGNLDDALKHRLIEDVRKVYNRSFSEGFYWGRPVGDFTDANGSCATHRKEFVGRVVNYYRQIGVVEVEVLDHPFNTGTPLLIIGETTGVVMVSPTGIRQENNNVKAVTRGVVTFRVPQRVRIGDKVYRQTRRQ